MSQLTFVRAPAVYFSICPKTVYFSACQKSRKSEVLTRYIAAQAAPLIMRDTSQPDKENILSVTALADTSTGMP